MQKDKNVLYYNRILRCLLNRPVYSISQLADDVGLSEKTVRTRVNQLNDWLEEHRLGEVRKKRGTGIWLDAAEDQVNRIREQLNLSGDMEVFLHQDNRNKQLTGRLLKLKSGETVTLQQLADSLCLSPPTVANKMKEVLPWFEKRSLHISSVRNKGVRVIGDEYNYRLAIKDYLIYMMPEIMEALLGGFAAGIDIYRIRRIIIIAENAWRIELADTSFHMVWILTCLSLTRPRSEGENKFEAEQSANIQYYVEYSFAESIYQRIGREFQVEIPHGDLELMTILLVSAKRINTILDINSEDYARQYDEKLKNFVGRVIETIDSVLDAGLTDDELLFESLLIHMRSAVFRMKYSTANSESISKYVKNEYKQTFLATWSTSYLFEEQYEIQVTEDELAGIALYIQAAILRQKRGVPLLAVLVSQEGQAASQLMMEMIRYNVPEITEIKAVSHHDFSIGQCREADLIITAVKLPSEDLRIVGIGEMVTDHGIACIREKVREIGHRRREQYFCFHNLCHQLFDIDLIFVRPKVKDKTELITMMVKKMEEKGDVTDHYLSSVLERENATTTSIGHGVAIPHGNMWESNEARVAVGILDMPVDWHGEMVDVVFLLGIKMTSDFEIKKTKQFYKDFMILTESDDNLETLKRMKSPLEIYQYLIR